MKLIAAVIVTLASITLAAPADARPLPRDPQRHFTIHASRCFLSPLGTWVCPRPIP